MSSIEKHVWFQKNHLLASHNLSVQMHQISNTYYLVKVSRTWIYLHLSLQKSNISRNIVHSPMSMHKFRQLTFQPLTPRHWRPSQGRWKDLPEDPQNSENSASKDNCVDFRTILKIRLRISRKFGVDHSENGPSKFGLLSRSWPRTPTSQLLLRKLNNYGPGCQAPLTQNSEHTNFWPWYITPNSAR